MRPKNPYENVNWQTTLRVQGSTHLHCTSQEELRRALAEGLEFVTLSNYHPSMPWWPLSTMRENTTRFRMPSYVQDGKVVHKELRFREAYRQWGEDVSQLPADEGELLFPDVPNDLLEAPNAEHHFFTDTTVYLHVTAPGCALASGRFDRSADSPLERHGIRKGMGLPWREGFAALLKSLVVPDGGGIIINHPQWSHLPVRFLCELLDFDERVLGMEIVNADCAVNCTAGSEPQWDEVLSTGRQCWGFCAQDHPKEGTPLTGRSILLVNERTPEACLRAYRQGCFYGALKGQGLRFESIEFDGRTIHARCDREAVLLLISRQGVVKEVWTGKELTYTVPDSERAEHVFFRVTAEQLECREKLYSQPIMLMRNS